MFILKSIKATFKFYMLYIQPLLGLYLVCSGLWMLYYPDASICTETSIELCTTSLIDTIRPSLYIIFGVVVVIAWYLTELLPKLRGDEKEGRIKSGVKPEDFVK